LKKKIKYEILYGIHSVSEAIKAGRRIFFEIFIVKGRAPDRLISVLNQAEQNNISVKFVSSSKIREITGSNKHQGIGASVSPYPLCSLDKILDIKNTVPNDYFLLIIDSIEDPQNLGALIRTALSAGVNGVIIPKNRAASPTPAVSKSSAGALEHICLIQVTNLSDTINTLKKNGVWITGTAIDAETNIFETDIPSPTAIIIGSEAKGLRPLIKKNCDFLVSIPQKGPVESMNASAAGAVVMYEVLRQRLIKL